MTDKPKEEPTLGTEVADEVAKALVAEQISADDVATSSIQIEQPTGLDISELAEQDADVQAKTAEIQAETQENVTALTTEDQFILLQLATFKHQKPEDLVAYEADEPWKMISPRPRMFQEAFCRQPFIVHQDWKDADKAANDQIIDYALVSPMRFPEVLWEHVTGVEPTGSKTSHEGMRIRYGMLPQLRTLFKNLQPVCDETLNPLKKDTGRVSIIPRQQRDLTEITTQKDWPRGSIIVSNNPRRIDGPKRHFSFYEDFYAFLRSLKHTANTYSGRYNTPDLEKRSEFEVLNQLRADIRASIDTLQNWKKLSPDQKEKVSEMIKELKELLADVRDQYKIFAREHLTDAESLQERGKPKYNPGSTCAKLVGSFNDVMKRFKNCVGIEQSVEESMKLLEGTKNAAEGQFKQLDDELEFLLREDDYFKVNRFVKDPEAVEIVLEDSETIAASLENKMIARLQALIDNDSLPAPYPQWAEAVLQNLQAAQIIMKRISQLDEEEVKALGRVGLEKVHEQAVENAVRANLTLRCIEAQQGLSKIISDILSRPWAFDPVDLYDEIDDIHRTVDPHAFREHYEVGDVGAKVLFKVEEVDQLSLYCRNLKHMLKRWVRERMRIDDDEELYHGKYQDVPTNEYLEKFSGFEDQRIDLDVAKLNEIYDEVKAFDFREVFNALHNRVERDRQGGLMSVTKRTSVAHRFLEDMNLYPKTIEDTPATGE